MSKVCCGIVRHIYGLRNSVDAENTENNGPLRNRTHTVFNITLFDANANKELHVYFYNEWAIKLHNIITKNDKVRLFTTKRNHYHTGVVPGEFDYCIVFDHLHVSNSNTLGSTSIRDNMKLELTLHDNFLVIDDEHLSSTEIPPFFLISNRQVNQPAISSSATSNSSNNPPNKKKKVNQDNYEYTQLSNLQVREESVNIYAIVVDIFPAKIAKGTHRYSKLYFLTDESLWSTPLSHDPSTAFPKFISLNIFSSAMNFPEVTQLGDIIRIHRAKVQEYNSKSQLVAWVDKKSSFVVFHRKTNLQSCLPLPIRNNDINQSAVMSSELIPLDAEWDAKLGRNENFTFTALDKQMLRRHFYWSLYKTCRNHNAATAPPPVQVLSLSNVATLSTGPNAKNAYLSHKESASDWTVTALVVSVDVPPEFWSDGDGSASSGAGTSYGGCIVVWDGSARGNIVSPIFKSQGNGKELEFEVPNDILIVLNNILKLSMIFTAIKDIPESTDSASVTSDSYEKGIVTLSSLENIYKSMSQNSVSNQSISGGFYLLPVRYDAKNLKSELSSLAPGAWVRFKRLSYVDDAIRAQVPVRLHRAIGGCIAPDTAVQNIPLYHKDVMAVMQLFYASARPVPRRVATSAAGTPYTNLAICLASSAPFSCLSLARIVSWYPQSLDRFVTSSCGSDTQTDGPPPLLFMFSVRVADDTAVADIIVFGKEGDCFFGGLSAATFQSDYSIRYTMQQLLEDAVTKETKFDFKLKTYLTASNPGQENHKRPFVKRVALFDSPVCILQNPSTADSNEVFPV